MKIMGTASCGFDRQADGTLSLGDWFTPFNQDVLNNGIPANNVPGDQDLGFWRHYALARSGTGVIAPPLTRADGKGRQDVSHRPRQDGEVLQRLCY